MRLEPYLSRKCHVCGTEITAAMGFVHSGDFLRLLRGEEVKEVRETCGRCIIKKDFETDPELRSLFKKQG